jgi:copper resistance protein C
MLKVSFEGLVVRFYRLSSSNPTEGQVVTENLEQITLDFATTIEELSKMELVKDGNKVALGEIKVENKQLIGRISKPLENGSYTIQWKIVGEDGHPINGEINFGVQTDQNQSHNNPVTPEEKQGTQEENTQTDKEEQNSVEQNNASDTVEQKPADGSDNHHGTTESKEEPKTEQPEAVNETTSSSNAPLYVSIAALIAGLLSLVISLKKRG